MQEFDWIFIDEATQFTKNEFRGIGGCLRGVNKIPKRMYLTCNPGGVGHQWVKDLFITRKFEANENPDDYAFIQAKATDNKDLMESSPAYMTMLDNLPESVRKAHRDGDWDALAGQYFSEFKPKTHTVEPFKIPQEWKKYRAFDYGLDCFACLWVAVDFTGRSYIYRELAQSGLIVSAAAEMALGCTMPGENIEYTIAPPDMWSTLKDSGKTMAQVFMENGLGLVKANNARVQGWLAMKEQLRLQTDGKPNLLIFNDCRGLIEDIQALQFDDKNPSDCSKQPHEITHRPDAARYYCYSRVLSPQMVSAYQADEEWQKHDYETEMCGGEMNRSYLNY